MEQTDRDRRFKKFYEVSRQTIIDLAPRATQQSNPIAPVQDHESASGPRSWLAMMRARLLRVLG